MQINCAKIDGDVRLSDHIRNEHEMVRVVNLQPGQIFTVDVTLDGGYTNPPIAPNKEPWTGKAGRQGVHTALLTFANGDGFTLRFADGVEVTNSQGRGVVFADCHNYHAHDVWVRGARTAGISHHDCTGFQAHNLTTIDTGNYQDNKNEGPNWPGSIKFEGCDNYKMFRPISIDHLGNGITATETSNGQWSQGIAIDVRGANYYVNAAPYHKVYDSLSVGEQAAYVVNSEEENDGTDTRPEVSEGIDFNACYSLDSRVGLGFWGNERKQGLVIDKACANDCVFIYTEDGLKIHPNATINSLDTGDTLTFKPSEVDAALLAAMRAQSAALKAAILRHAANEEIDTEARKLRELFARLRPVVVVPLYPLGQRLYVVGDVVDVDKANRVFAGGSVAGLQLQAVEVIDPTKALADRVRAALVAETAK